jgi:two-component system OmpR family response regulator
MLPPTLLVVEDDPLVMLSAAAALEVEGWVVKKAANGVVAMERLGDRSDPVDAVVIDIALGPGPTGWDVAHYARSVNQKMAVAYITGDMDAALDPQIVEGGVVLRKPIDDLALLAALNRLLEVKG